MSNKRAREKNDSEIIINASLKSRSSLFRIYLVSAVLDLIEIVRSET